MRLPAAGSRFEGPGADAIKQLDDVPKAVSGDALGDENYPRSVIAIRPTLEPAHRMQQMLCALNDRRPARFISDIQETFDAQKSWSEVLRNSVQQELRLLARQGAFARENEILDSPAFEMVTVRMAAAIVLVTSMVAVTSVMGMCGVLIGLHVEPGTGVRLRVVRVEAPRRKEFGDLRGRQIDLVNFG